MKGGNDMKKKTTALRYRVEILRFRLETRRWKFWAWVMGRFPRFYEWADKHLPFDTLPF